MTPAQKSRVYRIILILYLVFTSSSIKVFAALGEHESSTELEQHALKGTKKIILHGKFRVHEITSENNHLIREYISPDGIVFAVTWRGMTQPNLSLLLGSYFQEVNNALSSQPKHQGRAPLSISTDHVIIEKFGHMLDIHGKAYIPSLLPNDVSAQEVL